MTISTENLLSLYISLCEDPSRSKNLFQSLQSVFQSEGYQFWLAEEESSGRRPAVEVGQSHDLLREVNLATDHHLDVKINIIDEMLFLTDGLWAEPQWRVFPYADESVDVLEYIGTQVLSQFDWCLDLATGCGHVALRTARCLPTWGLDINPRALMFAKLNLVLNQIPASNCHLMLNNLRDGVHLPLRGKGLVLANLPFGPNPKVKSMPLTSAGGRYGLDFQLASMQALKAWLKDKSIAARVLLLGVSFGQARENRWQIEQEARKILGPDVKPVWTVLSHVKMPRTNGRREMTNPIPISEAFQRIVGCSVYSKGQDQNELGKVFQELATDLSQSGWTDLSYGILEFHLDGKP